MCRVARQVAVQHNKFVAASSAAKLRTRQEEELRAMVAEQERRATEFEKLFDLVSSVTSQCCQVILSLQGRIKSLSSMCILPARPCVVGSKQVLG